MRKLQQFYIFKFDSNRLKASNFNITLTPWQARKNGELISIGDSQMLRSLRLITNKENYQEELQELFRKKKYLQKNIGGKLDLYNIENRIDEILFIPEIISLNVKNVKHYEKIIKNGLFVNNKKYVRLMCSAGQARRNNVLLIDSDVEIELKKVLNNDRKDIEITPAKFNAYFALASSTALEVSTPLFCVIPDCKVMRKEIVEWVEEQEDGDDIIGIKEKELEFNLFDGQGLISPRMAKQWALDLEIDYIPSCFIIRSNFIKGMVCVFDFLEYSDEIGIHLIRDIYGNEVNIRDMDIILTESQFKLWNAFENTKDYVDRCRNNKLTWGVTRCSPKEENTHTFLNYQFLQALKLDQKQIESLCSKTVEYFENIMSNIKQYACLYLLGSRCHQEYDNNILNKIDDPVTKAILFNNDLIEDEYVQNHIINSLNRKIKDSYVGNLLVEGFYCFLVADPYAFSQYVFNQEITGLLQKNQYYNKYWLNKNEKIVAGMRSPLTWRSEVDIMHLVENDNIKKWYKYLNSGIITSVHGMDMAILAGADQDGDLVCLTNQKEIIDGAYGGLPIMYETKKTPKSKIIESELYLADLKGFFTKVGFLTNLSTTMYSMLPLFPEDSKEYQEIIHRLKQCRKLQGTIIDGTKGLIVKPIPPQWSNWQKIKDDMDKEEINRIKFDNSILIDKRPFFMSELYINYSKEYRQYYYNYNLYCETTFEMELQELLSMDNSLYSDEQKEFIVKFYKYNPLLDTDCTTNRICHYMQSKIKEIKKNSFHKTSIDIVRKLKGKYLKIDKIKYKKLYNIYMQYKSGKRNFSNIRNENGEERFKTLESWNKYIRQEALKISSDICELASLAVTLCYETYKSDNKSFCWSVFYEGLLENIKYNKQVKIMFPFSNNNGDIEYLGEKYLLEEIGIEEDYDYL